MARYVTSAAAGLCPALMLCAHSACAAPFSFVYTDTISSIVEGSIPGIAAGDAMTITVTLDNGGGSSVSELWTAQHLLSVTFDFNNGALVTTFLTPFQGGLISGIGNFATNAQSDPIIVMDCWFDGPVTANFSTGGMGSEFFWFLCGGNPIYIEDNVQVALTNSVIVPENWSPVAADADDDGIEDAADNCTMQANPNQVDTDGDGFGNACDTDHNQDCTVNFSDLGLFKPEFFGTNPAYDYTGDGVVNFADLARVKESFFTDPGPSGVPNACDLGLGSRVTLELGAGGLVDPPDGTNCTFPTPELISCTAPAGTCDPDRIGRVEVEIAGSPQGANDSVTGSALCGGLVIAERLVPGPAPAVDFDTGDQADGAATCNLEAKFFPGVTGNVVCAF